VLDHILSHDLCDVDPVNKLDKATPLHLAVATEKPEVKEYLVDNLLESGADFTFVFLILRSTMITVSNSFRIRNKYGETAKDLVKPDDSIILELFRKAEAEASISKDDIACESFPPYPRRPPYTRADDDEGDVASDDSD